MLFKIQQDKKNYVHMDSTPRPNTRTLRSRMACDDDQELPPPLKLTRQNAYQCPRNSPSQESGSSDSNTEELPLSEMSMINTRIDNNDQKCLDYICTLSSSKYPNCTWGYIIEKDYKHFIYLISNFLPIDSTTFISLLPFVKVDDQPSVLENTRYYDTEEYEKEQIERYLDFICHHKSKKHHGKTWRQVRSDSYGYFKWAVQNTMGRDTKTFKYLVQALQPQDIEKVIASTPSVNPRARR